MQSGSKLNKIARVEAYVNYRTFFKINYQYSLPN